MLKAHALEEIQQEPKDKPFSLFKKANIAFAFLVCAMGVNFSRWSNDAWYAILLMVIGFEMFTLVLMCIVKLKPGKKH
ncbi:hypothetical protein ACN6MY_11505 [Peribacillus sp. B-H-3]|uniref:hypothetical protein n=1 Tax=Peribacillus sp. B-H-3 TaxID=3400420 RepID=UPI003B027BFD